MSYIMVVVLGVIQGVAEFLPISSSGHLTLFQYFFSPEQNPEELDMLFTILLHFGTLISVCVYYWRDIIDMIREFFLGIAALAGKDTGTPPPPAAGCRCQSPPGAGAPGRGHTAPPPC